MRRELSLLKRSWRHCQSEGIELSELFLHFKMPPSGTTRRRIPTPNELKAIIQYTSPQVSALIQLGIETCCRRSELLSIEKRYVDFQSQTLWLPKAKTGSRYVPLSAKAIRILKKWNCNFTLQPSSVTSNVSKVCKPVRHTKPMLPLHHSTLRRYSPYRKRIQCIGSNAGNRSF